LIACGTLIPFSWIQEIRSMMGERRMMQEALFYGIRSERRLCEEVHLNLAYRWFL
jgi:transposase